MLRITGKDDTKVALSAIDPGRSYMADQVTRSADLSGRAVK